jgi:hypothetical protein
MNTSLLFSLIGLIGPFALTIALVLLIYLSARLGAALKRRKWYRLLYVSVLLNLLSIALHFLFLVRPELNEADNTLIYLLPMALGLLLAVLVIWRYWSWLLNEGTTGGF